MISDKPQRRRRETACAAVAPYHQAPTLIGCSIVKERKNSCPGASCKANALKQHRREIIGLYGNLVKAGSLAKRKGGMVLSQNPN
jgi:hypothetical protein